MTIERVRELLAEAIGLLNAVDRGDNVPPAPMPAGEARPMGFNGSVNPAAIGYTWFCALMGGAAPDARIWRPEYTAIGLRPAEQRKRVAQAIGESEWCKQNRRHVSPLHVVKYWDRYVANEPYTPTVFLPFKEQAAVNSATALTERLRLFDKETDTTANGMREASRFDYITWRAEQRTRIERGA